MTAEAEFTRTDMFTTTVIQFLLDWLWTTRNNDKFQQKLGLTPGCSGVSEWVSRFLTAHEHN